MATSITITSGAATATITFSGTDAKARAILRRYATSKAIPTELTVQQTLDAIMVSLAREIRNGAIMAHRSELVAAEMTAIETAIESDNSL